MLEQPRAHIWYLIQDDVLNNFINSLVTYTMNFDYIHPPFLQLLLPSLLCVLILILSFPPLISQVQFVLPSYSWRGLHQSMEIIPLKKTSYSSPKSFQMPVALRLRVELHAYPSPLCPPVLFLLGWYFSWLEFAKTLWVLSQLLWLPMFTCPIVSGRQFPYRHLHPCLLPVFLPPLSQWSLSLEGWMWFARRI